MRLTDRIVHQNADLSVSGDIPVHEFTSAVSLLAYGVINRNNVITIFSLDSDAASDLDKLGTAYSSLSTESAKAQFLNRLESAGILFQSGKITAQQYKTIMGL